MNSLKRSNSGLKSGKVSLQHKKAESTTWTLQAWLPCRRLTLFLLDILFWHNRTLPHLHAILWEGGMLLDWCECKQSTPQTQGQCPCIHSVQLLLKTVLQNCPKQKSVKSILDFTSQCFSPQSCCIPAALTRKHLCNYRCHPFISIKLVHCWQDMQKKMYRRKQSNYLKQRR